MCQSFAMTPEHFSSESTLIENAWPGGYPMYYADSQGEVLCPQCANLSLSDEFYDYETTKNADVNYEDPQLFCAVCEKRIESAYADEE